MKKEDAKKELQENKKRPLTPPKPEGEKKKEIKKGNQSEKRPFMQVDKSGDVIFNFLSNFLRQLKNPTKSELGKLLGRLLFIKIEENEKEPQKPSDLIGPVKTVFCHVNNPEGAVESPSQNKSLSQRTSQSNNTALNQS
ncbi:hypothetical protein [Flavobacterium sp. T12S277]|uniref:hypothetical protein n=1 Tax=Flavobacterium sp. T12S277 TaxID=3402752 RepID=UPI003ADE3254